MLWLWYLATALIVLNSLRMRARLRSIPVLGRADSSSPSRCAFTAIPGVTVDAATRAAAESHAATHDLALLDLIPADTPALVALGIVQIFDPAAYSKNPIAVGYSSGYALLSERTLAARSEEHTSELQSLRHLVCRLLL